MPQSLAGTFGSGTVYTFEEVAMQPSGSAPPPSAPEITTQPASQTITATATATFTAAAAGYTSVKWQKGVGGTYVDISGATSASYMTPATVVGESGSTYRVVFTGAGGSTTSAAATLTVSAAPISCVRICGVVVGGNLTIK